MSLLLQANLTHATAPPPPPDLLARVGIEQRLGAQLPMRAVFMDQTGHAAPLSQWIGERPALLMLGYFDCPNLCDVTEQAMTQSLKRAGLHAGADVSVIFLSIDPHESSIDAMRKQQQLMHVSAGTGIGEWHFLTGSDASIQSVTSAAGYRYLYDSRLKQYAHPAGAMVVRADGHINQYLLGVTFLPQTVRLAVVEASHRTLGNLVDQLVLLCCGYDPTTGRYTVTVVRMMQWLGSGFVCVLAVLFVLLRRARRGMAA